MRSLYFKMGVTILAALSLSLWAFTAISDHVEKEFINPVFDRMDELELESTLTAWSQGGVAAVARNMEHLNRIFGPSHYLLTSNGIDVVSGKNLVGFLPHSPATSSRGFVGRRFIVTHRSSDGRYWFLTVGPQQPGGWEFSSYYFLVIGVTAFLCCLTAFGVVLPIRGVTATLERYGQGDLSARSPLCRQDEIGDLALSFNAMAERLQRLLESKRRLLEDISHELRSPLARLTLAVKLARTSTDTGSALERIEREVKRITALTAEIVEMTRMDGDPEILKLDSVNLADLVHEAVNDCSAEVEPRKCLITIDERFCGTVLADHELLLRAVENILRNAIRYSPELAPIDVAVAQNGRDVSITIRDRGPGVPDNALSLIFEPFFRVDAVRGPNTGGIGLGLSIAKRAVELHNGTVTAQNATPGLRVELCLPRR